MSRIGKKPILLPTGVDVTIDSRTITVTGPKGTLTGSVHPFIEGVLVDGEDGKELVFSLRGEATAEAAAQWGTARANAANMVQGVSVGFSKSLEVNGVGFRVAVSGNNLNLVLGFSHDINFAIPEGITITVDKNVITVAGIDRHLVGETAARIRSLKKPEPYLGKGIKYTDEIIRRKAGKAAKSGE